MNRNVNVFIGVVLCAVLCGCFVWLNVSTDETAWGPNEIYFELQSASSSGASYTNATFVAPSSGDVALPLSSSSLRRGAVSLYAGATPSSTNLPSLQGGAGGRLIPSLQGGAGGTLSSGGGLYATSSAEFKSFGGGGNGGSSMGGGSMRGASSSSSLTASSPISLPSLQGGAGGRLSSSDPTQMVAENPMLDAASAASIDYSAFGNPAAGFYNAYASGSYGSMGNYGGGRSGIRGRQNALGFNNAWWVWFDTWVNTDDNGVGYLKDGEYYFNQYQLREVYEQFLANFWNSGMGEEPTFEDWLDWYQSAMEENGYYTYNEHNYHWVPVGDILPLLLLALLYFAFVVFKSSKPLMSLKSLLSSPARK